MTALLALDTSSAACSVAACRGRERAFRHRDAEREHTRLLMPMLDEVLDELDIELSDLDAVVVGNGPGSFIGMRIAAAVAQGLAFGAGLPVVPVSSLAAVAAAALERHSARYVAVTQDAHMQEVYFGLYERDPDRIVRCVSGERLARQEPLAELAAVSPDSCVAAGEGWRRYPELLAQNASSVKLVAEPSLPDARELLELGRVALHEGRAIDPEALEPAYLRQKVASEAPRQSR